MSPTKTKTSTLDELEQLNQAIREAQRQADAAEAERRSSSRWLGRARAALGDYLAAIDNGSDRNADAERELRDNVMDAEASRVDLGGVGINARHADKRAIRRHADAIDAVQEAQGAVLQFVVEHRAELQDEMRNRSLQVRDRLLDAIEELSAAGGQWAATARDWRTLLERWGDPSPAEIPSAPLPGIALQDIEEIAMQVRGGARDPRGAIPMPASLAPGAEDEERHTTPLRGWEHRVRVISTEAGLGT